jgi:hypothetical protein
MLFGRFLALCCLVAVSLGLRAQDVDFLKHRKAFDICSIKKQCAQCYTCNQERCMVRIQNKSDKKIVGVYYKFYSPVFNKIVEKEAKIEGNKIPGKEIGGFYICVIDARHWIISKVEYEDESAITYVLHDRMENFLQEADECDCNLTH